MLKSGKTKKIIKDNIDYVMSKGFTKEEAIKIANSKAKLKSKVKTSLHKGDLL